MLKGRMPSGERNYSREYYASCARCFGPLRVSSSFLIDRYERGDGGENPICMIGYGKRNHPTWGCDAARTACRPLLHPAIILSRHPHWRWGGMPRFWLVQQHSQKNRVALLCIYRTQFQFYKAPPKHFVPLSASLRLMCGSRLSGTALRPTSGAE